MAFDTFLFLDKIAGESTATITEKPQGLALSPMEIYSFSFGVSNPTTLGSHSGGLSAGKVSFDSFNIMKRSDDASPVLFSCCCTGQHIAKASVVMRKATGKDGKQQAFLQYNFSTVIVESIQWSGSSGGDDTPTESVSFAYGSLAITNFKQDATGKMTKGSGGSWDRITVTSG